MNALVRKEIRLILPAWALAMVLAALPIWLIWPGPHGLVLPTPGVLVFAPFGLGVLLLSITPFGQEIGFGTFSILLAQPTSRQRLWGAKISVLAIALVLAFIALCLSNYVRVDSVVETMKGTTWRNAFNRNFPGSPLGDPQFLKMIAETRQAALESSLVLGALVVAAAFAGGLWTTLFFRQTSAAFWFTLLVPLGLGLLTAKAFENFSDGITNAGLLVVIGLYSLAGSVWARRLFLQGQDTQWTGGIISLPPWRATASGATSGTRQQARKPLRALMGKEFQSHQVNLIIAAGLLLVQLAVLVVRKLSGAYLAAHPSTAMILESFPLLWLAMPLLLGSVTIAEERKLGTLEGSLCLPTTRRLQFLAKFGTALFLGVLMGAVVPSLLEGVGAWIGLAGTTSSSLAVENRIFSILAFTLLGSAGLTVLSVYGSSLARNTLQALGAAVSAAVLASVVIALAVVPFDFNGIIPWRGPLVGFIGWPVMTVIIFFLGYQNYQHLQVDLRVWLRNGLVVLISLIGVATLTTVAYHRVWEAWMPEEPLHPFAMGYLTNPKRSFTTTPKLQTASSRIALILSDGRLWLRQRSVEVGQWKADQHGNPVASAAGPWQQGFIAGSNWVDLAMSDVGCFAIKTDGTLWDFSETQIGNAGPPPRPQPFGPDGDWKSISAGGQHFVALKSDGTLWQWQFSSLPYKKLDSRWPWIRAKYIARMNRTPPAQVGTDNDWIAVCDSPEVHAAVKSDGSIWRWGSISSPATNGVWKFTRTAQHPERWLEWPGKQPVSLSLSSSGIAGVSADGTLWFGGHLSSLLDPASPGRAEHEMIQWGHDSDWKEARIHWWQVVVAIKRDGSLWQWYPFHGRRGHWAEPPTLASHYFDWVTASSYSHFDTFLALAGDGTLCLWGDPDDRGYHSWIVPDPSRLLMPSRLKARRIADVLK